GAERKLPAPFNSVAPTERRLFRRISGCEVVRRHHGRSVGRSLRRLLQQLEVEALLELAAELRALGPADLGIDQAADAEVELDERAVRQLLAAFDQRSPARNIPEARSDDLALIMQQGRPDDADARLAWRQLLGKCSRAFARQLSRLI